MVPDGRRPVNPAASPAPAGPATLLATCDRCGDVVVEVQRSRVRQHWQQNHGTYEFDCPVCGVAVLAPASEHLLRLLTCLGAVCVP